MSRHRAMIYGAYKSRHLLLLDMKYGLLLLGERYLCQHLFGTAVREQGLDHSFFPPTPVILFKRSKRIYISAKETSAQGGGGRWLVTSADMC